MHAAEPYSVTINVTLCCLGDGRHEVGRMRDEDDELLQFAIQQSLLEPGTENDQVRFKLYYFAFSLQLTWNIYFSIYFVNLTLPERGVFQ